MKPTAIKPATPADYGSFISLWEEFLKERELGGSIILCSEPALRHATDLFYRIVYGSTPGLVLIAPGRAMCLWGPEFPLPTRLGRTLIAQGTFVRADFRAHGWGMALFHRARALAEALGFDAILSSVDSGNALSERNAAQVGYTDVQVTKIISTHDEVS